MRGERREDRREKRGSDHLAWTPAVCSDPPGSSSRCLQPLYRLHFSRCLPRSSCHRTVDSHHHQHRSCKNINITVKTAPGQYHGNIRAISQLSYSESSKRAELLWPKYCRALVKQSIMTMILWQKSVYCDNNGKEIYNCKSDENRYFFPSSAKWTRVTTETRESRGARETRETRETTEARKIIQTIGTRGTRGARTLLRAAVPIVAVLP